MYYINNVPPSQDKWCLFMETICMPASFLFIFPAQMPLSQSLQKGAVTHNVQQPLLCEVK